MPEWHELLILAAARRARVRTRDGLEGVLVYAPGTDTAKGRGVPPVRHGDRSKCGVRLDGATSGKVTAVDPLDITDIINEGRK